MIGQTHIVALSGGLCLFKTPEPKNAAGISARIDQPETATVARKALERISRRHNSYSLCWPRIPRISRKRSLRFGCHRFEIQIFRVSPGY